MIVRFFGRLRRDKTGQGLVEYGLIIAGVALICAAAISIFGHKTNDMVAATAAVLPGARADDNGPIRSGQLIETTGGSGANDPIRLNGGAIAEGGARLGDNTGLDTTTLIVE
jgi:pilus assembly protein Flp/PilA